MSLTRFAPVVAIVALGGFLVGATMLDRDPDPAPAVAFGSITVPPMPIATTGAPLSSSWFCPGVPAGAPEGGSGTISVLNPGDDPISGTVTAYPSEGQPVVTPLTVKERSRTDIRLSEVAPSPWTAAVVEILGAEGVVEQAVTGPTGRSASGCANSASSTWYLADGATTLDASLGLLLLNPFPDDAIVDIAFSTDEGTRTPQAVQGLPIRGRSLRFLPLNDVILREPTIATSVVARTGRVVTGRVQTYVQGSKRTLGVGIASPVPSEAWWFATGDKSEQAFERLSVFNPGDSDAEVDISFFPADPAAPPIDPVSVTVPAMTSVVVDVSTTEGVPAGQHSIYVQSEPGRPVVAERALDVQGDAALNVTMQPGTPLVSTRWTFVTGAADGSETLVIANTTGEESTVTVSALGVTGFLPIPGLEALVVPPAGVVRIDLDEKGVAGQPVTVDATLPVAAERIIGAPTGQPGISITRGIPTPIDG